MENINEVAAREAREDIVFAIRSVILGAREVKEGVIEFRYEGRAFRITVEDITDTD